MCASISVLSLLETFLAFVTLVCAARVARGALSRLAKHLALRDVRGPKRSSILTGNLQDLYGIGGLHHLEALSEYGGVAKVHGILGVSTRFE